MSRILYTECPLCESANFKEFRYSDCSANPRYNPVISPTMVWNRCDDCSHVFTDGYFSEKVNKIILDNVQDTQLPGADFENLRNVSARIVDRVKKYSSYGRWLDVGFGNGSILFTAHEFGYKPVGLDIRMQTVAAMKRFEIEAYCADIATFHTADRHTVVSMSDVLEHMPFPKKALSAAHGLLSNTGVLFLSMPAYDSIGWRLAECNCPGITNSYWGEIEHFHNFSKARLYRLLGETGFEPVHYYVSERYRLGMEIIARRI